jgi:Ca2+-binding EF-hand superfamily protein
MFLSRLGIIPRSSDGFIPYRDLLASLKERLSTQNLLSSASDNDDENLHSSLAGQIEYLIAQNCDELEKVFHQLDSAQRGYLSPTQWKAFLEDLLEFPLRADEFDQLNKSFPRDQQGNLKWRDLLQQIDKRKPSLLQDNQQTSV